MRAKNVRHVTVPLSLGHLQRGAACTETADVHIFDRDVGAPAQEELDHRHVATKRGVDEGRDAWWLGGGRREPGGAGGAEK